MSCKLLGGSFLGKGTLFRNEQRTAVSFLNSSCFLALRVVPSDQSPLLSGQPRRPISSTPSADSAALKAITAPALSLDDYVVTSKLGQGAFSQVRKAVSLSTNQPIVLKEFRKDGPQEKEITAQFRSEVEILTQLDSPFLSKMVGVAQKETANYIALEYEEGQDLFDLMSYLAKARKLSKSGGLPEELAKFHFSEILLGLEYLHEKDIVWADLKPENILLNREGHSRLIDFGTAKKIDKDSLFPPDEGHTLEYMAPEMINGQDGYNHRADIWSLGVLLYEMLCGKSPFKAPTIQDIKDRILRAEYINDAGSENARGLISQLLCVDPKRRISLQEAKLHPWFAETVNWEGLASKSLEPPIPPQMVQEYGWAR